MNSPDYYVLNPWLTYEEFLQALEIYRSLQAQYLSDRDNEKLKGLETWFTNVIEPTPDDKNERKHWLSREMTKKQGHTYYCDTQAKKIVYVSVNEWKKVIQLVTAINNTLN